VSLADIQLDGPIRHPELSPFLLGIIGWTYRVVGRYVRPTLEQWELGFMRDMHPDREVAIWHRLAFAFVTYHRRRDLPLRSRPEELELIGAFLHLNSAAERDDSEEGLFVRQCFKSPDGWEEESARMDWLMSAPDPTWSSPEGLEGWAA
jgi:hypothetical protein